jgi:DNA polymerase
MERQFEIHPADAAAKLAWLVMAGVDTPVDDAPRRWLKPASPPGPVAALTAASGAAPAHPARPKPAPAPNVERPSFAAQTVDAPTLERLAECVTEFAHPLRRPDLAATLLTGNAASGVIILCDQPEEDGSPAATLRTRMLAAIGLDAENSALLYRLPWPTTGARAPRADELAAFAPFVARALALSRPRLMLALGQHAAAIAGEPMALASARGRWATVTIGDAVIPLLATCLPRLLLSQPARKREAWADLQAFSARLLEMA